MKRLKNIFLLLAVMLSVSCFTSCKDDDPVSVLVPTDTYQAVILSATGGNISESMVKSLKRNPTMMAHMTEEQAYAYWQTTIDSFIAKYASGFKVAEEIEDAKGNVIDEVPFEGVLNVVMALQTEAGNNLQIATFELTPTSSKLISVEKTIDYKAVVVSAEGSNLSDEYRQEWLEKVCYCSAVTTAEAIANWDAYLDELNKQYANGIKVAGRYQDDKLLWTDIPFDGTLVVKLNLLNANGDAEKTATLTITNSSCTLQK
ncbi:MAG: hypothetical protein K2M53_01915 [Muribaculaceae bacterium]|nr:hypothetical protein [Muribaculaceae bacterium]